MVEEIVNLVLMKLPKRFVKSKGLVGIDKKVAHVESLIHRESRNNYCLIGIWGMGGIGKTTLAEEVFKFNKLQFEYEGTKLVHNEREQSRKRELTSLRKEIFSELLGNDVKIDTLNSLPGDIARRIGHMKVLIVLDDVNDSSHLVKLLGDLDNFGLGSTLIVTTRDEHVLKANNAHEIYQVGQLSSDEALELFNLNAFNQMDHQKEEYHELAKRMVYYAKGSPLVVTVLARRLHGKNKEIWEGELDKLNKMPLKEVYDVMKLSYDDLDRKEQQTFLDLACFFLKLHRMVKVDHLKSLLKDESDQSVAATLVVLKNKALVTLSEDNFISMHDCLQEMGLEIVQSKDPRSRSWLWDPEHICEALENGKGTKAIRSIQIDLVKIKEQKLSPDIFTNMSQLKFLEIYYGSYQHNILAEGIHLRLPDLSKATNLEVLRLWGCSKLAEVHPSIFSLPKLEKLDLWNCTSLRKLASDSHLQSLTYLNLDGCARLQEFSVIAENMRDLRWNHLLFGLPINAESLHVERCFRTMYFKSFKQLLNLEITSPGLETIVDLPPLLETLHVKDCSQIHIIPKLPMSLKTLNVENCYLKSLLELPPSLKTLHVSTKSIKSLPKLPLSLEILNAHDCTSLRALPDLPSSLKTLKVSYCTSLQTLPELPPLLENLDARGCRSLHTIGKLPDSLKTLDVAGCISLQTLPELPPLLENLDAGGCKSLHSLKTLDVTGCTSLKTLPELPPLLENLDAAMRAQLPYHTLYYHILSLTI